MTGISRNSDCIVVGSGLLRMLTAHALHNETIKKARETLTVWALDLVPALARYRVINTGRGCGPVLKQVSLLSGAPASPGLICEYRPFPQWICYGASIGELLVHCMPGRDSFTRFEPYSL